MERGWIVESCFGHDKDRYYLVVSVTQDGVYIADGKRRKLGNPKRKNPKHLRATGESVNVDSYDTDKKIRKLLWRLNESEPTVEP